MIDIPVTGILLDSSPYLAVPSTGQASRLRCRAVERVEEVEVINAVVDGGGYFHSEGGGDHCMKT